MTISNADVRIHIVQPSVPPYRKAFFEYFNTHFKAEIFLYSSPVDMLMSHSVKEVVVSHYDPTAKLSRFPFSTFFQHVRPDFQAGDILVINGNPRMISNFWLVFRARANRVRIVWWGHGWSPTSRPLRARIRRFLTKRMADAVLLYTDKERDTYIQAGFDKHRTFALNNGVDAALISKLSKAAASKQLSSQDHVVLPISTLHNAAFIGRLTEKSGIEMLLRQFHRIDSRVGLVIIGGGELEDLVAELIVSLNLTDRVFMAGAAYEEQAIAAWMVRCNLFVYPGSVGLSVLHAFAYGLPAVIHTNFLEHGPEAGLFENGINGIGFKQGDPGSLVKAINALALHPKRHEMGKFARQQVLADYSYETMAVRFGEVLNFVAPDQITGSPDGAIK